MKDVNGVYAASLSLNQINWDGIANHLPSWDDVAGDPTDYSKTYVPEGNTLVLLSMNVNQAFKGDHLPSKMIKEATKLAQHLGASYLIGSFRPSGYGYIKKGMGYDIEFSTYCQLKRVGSDKPVDAWLGSLWHVGMKMLKEDEKAMTVEVPYHEFLSYKSIYHKGQWEEVKQGVWECGEVGSWTINPDTRIATYQESNMWGILPLT